MTYRQYLQKSNDKMEGLIVILNDARKLPNYDNLSEYEKRRVLNTLLNSKMSSLLR